MNPNQDGDCPRKIPEIVHVVLSQVARLRHCGEIAAETFQEKIECLAREELRPRGLDIVVRDLPDGRTRFLIKEKPDGHVRDLIEYPATNGHNGHGAAT